MARRNKAWKPDEDEPALDISSLIDVVFLLLIYFIVTSQLIEQEKDLKMDLPSSAPSDEIANIDPLLLVVRSDGLIVEGADDNRLSLSEDPDDRMVPRLFERLNTLRQAAQAENQVPVVQVYVEDGAVQQRVVDVLNALKRANIDVVTFTDLVND